MNQSEVTARERAIDWAVRATDPSFDDWEALADWLAANPANAVLYDRATIAAMDAEHALRDDAPYQPASFASRARWLPFAIAASLIATVGGGGWLYQHFQQPTLYTLSTVAGAKRSITLVGAVRIDLNGDTSITLDHDDQRFARIDRGQALFTVVHDSDRPFRVRAGNVSITDLGTIFDVDHGVAGVRVGVAEGEVRIAAPGGSLNVAAGKAATVIGSAVTQYDQDRASIGVWRRGQIDFADISMAELATRVHRASGARIEVAPGIAQRRVSGSIVVDAGLTGGLGDIALLLGIDVSRRGNSWIWSAQRSADP